MKKILLLVGLVVVGSKIFGMQPNMMVGSINAGYEQLEEDYDEEEKKKKEKERKKRIERNRERYYMSGRWQFDSSKGDKGRACRQLRRQWTEEKLMEMGTLVAVAQATVRPPDAGGDFVYGEGGLSKKEEWAWFLSRLRTIIEPICCPCFCLYKFLGIEKCCRYCCDDDDDGGWWV